MKYRFPRSVACLVIAVQCFICKGHASELTNTISDYSRACGFPGVLFEFTALLPQPIDEPHFRPV